MKGLMNNLIFAVICYNEISDNPILPVTIGIRNGIIQGTGYHLKDECTKKFSMESPFEDEEVPIEEIKPYYAYSVLMNLNYSKDLELDMLSCGLLSYSDNYGELLSYEKIYNMAKFEYEDEQFIIKIGDKEIDCSCICDAYRKGFNLLLSER